jgi:hypothetical protein
MRGLGEEGMHGAINSIATRLANPCGWGIGWRGVYLAKNVIRVVPPVGTIHSVAGNGFAGFGGDLGPATNAELNFPGSRAYSVRRDIYRRQRQ